MADLNTVMCEVCHVLRKETNHWWTAYTLKDEHGRDAGAMVLPFTVTQVSWPFRKKLPKPTAHLCGQAHVQVWMEGQLNRAGLFPHRLYRKIGD
jgi:hypothetical protein